MNKLIYLMIGSMLIMPGLSEASCNSNIRETTPASEFTDHGDGTVSHARTALMWSRCALGQTWIGSTCSGTPSKHTWQDALQQAGSSSYAGYTNWRLPNVKELVSIIERRCANPAINSVIFPTTPTFYFWSSSPLAGMGAWAHSVSFSDGSDNVENKVYSEPSFNGHVRLVREAR